MLILSLSRDLSLYLVDAAYSLSLSCNLSLYLVDDAYSLCLSLDLSLYLVTAAYSRPLSLSCDISISREFCLVSIPISRGCYLFFTSIS